MEEFWEEAYMTLNGFYTGKDAVPGVDNAFAIGSYCEQRYASLAEARDRLCERLGVLDEDEDIETILVESMRITEELCKKMYEYGAKFHGRKE